MKKLFIVAMALLIALATVTPALATGGGGGKGPRGTIALVGAITAVDTASGVVTVRVLKGNKLVHPYIGQNLALATTSSTRYLYKSSATAIPTAIALADLRIGDPASVNGVANGEWTASRITVGASLSCFP